MGAGGAVKGGEKGKRRREGGDFRTPHLILDKYLVCSSMGKIISPTLSTSELEIQGTLQKWEINIVRARESRSFL